MRGRVADASTVTEEDQPMDPRKPLTAQAAERAARWTMHLQSDIATMRRYMELHPESLMHIDIARMESDIAAMRSAIVAGVEPHWQGLNFDPYYAETDINSAMYAGGGK